MIPINSTTVSILRATPPDGDPDGYPDTVPTWTAVQTGLRAVISTPSGVTVRDGSIRTLETFRLAVDPCGLLNTDRVLDEQTQVTYECNWAVPRTGMGLDHVEADLRIVSGFAP